MRPRRTRNTAARRAAHAMWPRRCRRARSAKARPRAASPRRKRRVRLRPSTARSARTRPRARPRLGRRRMHLGPGRPRLRKGCRKAHLRSATMLSRRQQTGVFETIEPPSWSLDRTPAARAGLQDTELTGISQRVSARHSHFPLPLELGFIRVRNFSLGESLPPRRRGVARAAW